MIKKDIQSKLINNTPLIFTYNEVINNPEGLPIDFKLLEVNQNFEEKFKINKKDAIGKNMSEWLLKSNNMKEAWLDSFKELLITEEKKEFEQVLEFDEQLYLITAFVPYSGFLIILFHDVLKSNEARNQICNMHEVLQSSLDKSIAFSKSIFDNAPIAMIIYEVVGSGKSSNEYILRSVNDMCIKLEGWENEEVIGKTLKEVRPGVDEFGIVAMFQRVWITGETIHYPAKVYHEGENYRWFENTIFKLPTGEIAAVYEDVTIRVKTAEELFEEKEKLNVTLYSIGDGVITTDKKGNVELINKITEELTGWKQEEAKGKPLSVVFNIYNEVTKKPCENPVDLVLKHGKIVELANHTILISRDGTERVIADSAAPIKDKNGKILGVVLVFRDITIAKEKEDKIKYLSFRDSLTGLYNRTYFEEEIKRLDNEENYPLTFIMGDLDGLKLINDVFGHQIGDEALVRVAEIFKACCREKDTISRWGGDEFVVLLPKTPEHIAQKICDRIKKYGSDLMVSETKLSISLGYSTKNNTWEKWQDVLKKAEDNMYRTKLLGAKSYRNIVLSSMKSALYERSYETEEHCERLGKYCREVGKLLGLSSLELDELEVLAMLHDIGKIGIDDIILNKPDKLTEEEWVIMKKHPSIGYRIAQSVPELLNIADYILSHHERWDGKGYPRELEGLNIPLLARILSVVDAYDAMTQDRPYRKALSTSYAIEELIKNSGMQFDPKIVDIFVKYLKENE